METRSQFDAPARAGRLIPVGIGRLVLAFAAALLAGALYLIAARGEALLLDLSAFSQRLFCF
jgi:hypothetical protein